MYSARKYTKDGFTLTEILISIVIVGIIGAVGFTIYRGVVEGARSDATKTQLKQIEKAISLFEMHTGRYPARLRDLVKKPQGVENWRGEYMKKVPRDGWGRNFVYRPVKDGNNPYTLYSYGSNGKGAPKKEWMSVWKM